MPSPAPTTLAASVVATLVARSGDVSQRQLAEMLGISEKHMSLVITGKARVSWELAERWAEAVGCQLVAVAAPGPAGELGLPSYEVQG